jgi:phosphoglycerate dehydrogenase-like enzyme
VETLLIAEDDLPMRLVEPALGTAPDERLQAAMRRFFGPGWPGTLAQLQALGRELGLAGRMRSVLASAEPLERQLAEVECVFAESTPITAAAIRAAPRLRLIQTNGNSARHVDLAAAAARGVTVKTLRRWVNTSVAEHTLLLMMSVERRLLAAHRAAAAPAPAGRGPGGASAYNWVDLEGLSPLRGKTLGVVGLGEIGREVAALAQALLMRTLYFQRTRLPPDEDSVLGVAYRPLHALLAESDVVSLHVPLSDATQHLLGAAELARMKPGAVLINTSRGRLVDEAALLAALQAGRLRGAGLDVRHDEPPRDAEALAALDGVVLTPHVAAGSGLELLADARQVLQNLAERPGPA